MRGTRGLQLGRGTCARAFRLAGGCVPPRQHKNFTDIENFHLEAISMGGPCTGLRADVPAGGGSLPPAQGLPRHRRWGQGRQPALGTRTSSTRSRHQAAGMGGPCTGPRAGVPAGGGLVPLSQHKNALSIHNRVFEAHELPLRGHDVRTRAPSQPQRNTPATCFIIVIVVIVHAFIHPIIIIACIIGLWSPARACQPVCIPLRMGANRTLAKKCWGPPAPPAILNMLRRARGCVVF